MSHSTRAGFVRSSYEQGACAINLSDQDLIDAYIAGRLDAAGFAELEQRLRSSEETRQLLKSLTRVDLALHDMARNQVQHLVIDTTGKGRDKSWLLSILIVVFVIVGIGILQNFFVAQPTSTSINYIATLHDAHNVTWGSTAWIPGQRIPTGECHIKSGSLTLVTDKGVELRIRGPSQFELKSVNEIKLISGNIQVIRAGKSNTYAVSTNTAVYGDNGQSSDYIIELVSNEEHVLVSAGEVVRTAFGDSDVVSTVPAGQARRFAKSHSEIMPFDKAKFQYQESGNKTYVKEPPYADQSFAVADVQELKSKELISRKGWKQGWSINQDPNNRMSESHVQVDGKRLTINGDIVVQNKLSNPIQLNRQQNTFVHVIYEHDSADDVYHAALIILRSNNARYALKAQNGLQLSMETENQRVSTVLQNRRRGVMHMIIKVAGSAAQPDQILGSIYEDKEVPFKEPHNWQIYGSLFRSNNQIDYISFRVMSQNSAIHIYRITVGPTYESVTSGLSP